MEKKRRKVGIKKFATGGIGGAHRDGQNSMDISAAVFSSGVKSILDIPRTQILNAYMSSTAILTACPDPRISSECLRENIYLYF